MTHLIETISILLQHAGFGKDDVSVDHDEKAGIVWFTITAKNTHHLLTRDAEALSALNHIATKVSEKYLQEKQLPLRVVIDAGGVEKRKIENLRTIAHMMAERARYFKSSVALDAMPPYDRRIVHEFLANLPDIVTESNGEGRERHVVVRYKEPETL